MANLQWDIFCKVIDNFGDIGICWRLAADLAARGERVRLWVDDSSALAWMAPEGRQGVQVLRWTETLDVSCLDTTSSDVLIEAFGCEAAPEFITARARIDAPKPLWINLEYLSAESYVARNHGLTSLVSSGPAAGSHKVFFYPGFTPGTGGLLREPDLPKRQAAFDRAAWLRQHGIEWRGETLVSLFCYEPTALAQLLHDLNDNGIKAQPVRLLVTAGRAAQAVKSLLASEKAGNTDQIGHKATKNLAAQLSISYLPLLTQIDFDHLLWASDINFVRGEDSIVRAIWAGKPFVWQIYPQDDGAHGPKLEAFLHMLAAPPGLRAFHRVWNGLSDQALPPLTDSSDWQQTAAKNRAGLAAQPDLTSRLLSAVNRTVRF